MREFVTINGIDIAYSDIILENDIETVKVVCSNFDIISNTIKKATCIVPLLSWSEIDGFDDDVIKYLTNILSHCSYKIIESAKVKKDPIAKEKKLRIEEDFVE